MDEKKKKQKQDDILNAGITGASYETVQKYGDAAKQHYVAYSGIDNETEKNLVKGLKQISEEKINPDYEFAVLMPMEQDEEAIESGQGEVLIFRYFEDEDGDPNFEPIEDDDIAQTAVEAFQSMIDNGDINIEFSEDESEDEEEVSTASVGGNSIDLGDVVVHLDDYK